MIETKIRQIKTVCNEGHLPDSFSLSFIYDMEGALNEWGSLTPNQERAVENIYKKYRVDSLYLKCGSNNY